MTITLVVDSAVGSVGDSTEYLAQLAVSVAFADAVVFVAHGFVKAVVLTVFGVGLLAVWVGCIVGRYPWLWAVDHCMAFLLPEISQISVMFD